MCAPPGRRLWLVGREYFSRARERREGHAPTLFLLCGGGGPPRPSQLWGGPPICVAWHKTKRCALPLGGGFKTIFGGRREYKSSPRVIGKPRRGEILLCGETLCGGFFSPTCGVKNARGDLRDSPQFSRPNCGAPNIFGPPLSKFVGAPQKWAPQKFSPKKLGPREFLLNSPKLGRRVLEKFSGTPNSCA